MNDFTYFTILQISYKPLLLLLFLFNLHLQFYIKKKEKETSDQCEVNIPTHPLN